MPKKRSTKIEIELQQPVEFNCTVYTVCINPDTSTSLKNLTMYENRVKVLITLKSASKVLKTIGLGSEKSTSKMSELISLAIPPLS